jgi:hypothetical protein
VGLGAQTGELHLGVVLREAGLTLVRRASEPRSMSSWRHGHDRHRCGAHPGQRGLAACPFRSADEDEGSGPLVMAAGGFSPSFRSVLVSEKEPAAGRLPYGFELI